MSQQNLESLLKAAGNTVDMLRNSQHRRLYVSGGAQRVLQLAR